MGKKNRTETKERTELDAINVVSFLFAVVVVAVVVIICCFSAYAKRERNNKREKLSFSSS